MRHTRSIVEKKKEARYRIYFVIRDLADSPGNLRPKGREMSPVVPIVGKAEKSHEGDTI